MGHNAGQRLCGGYFSRHTLVLQSFVTISQLRKKTPLKFLECSAMKRGDSLKFKFSIKSFVAPIVTLELQGGILCSELYFDDTQTQRGKLTGRFWEGDVGDSEQLTQFFTFSPAREVFSSCNHHPLLAQTLFAIPGGKGNPCSDSIYNCKCIQNPLSSLPDSEFQLEQSKYKGSKKQPPFTGLRQISVCVTAGVPQGLGPILSPWLCKSFVRLCVG